MARRLGHHDQRILLAGTVRRRVFVLVAAWLAAVGLVLSGLAAPPAHADKREDTQAKWGKV
jgi:hypothetical protein